MRIELPIILYEDNKSAVIFADHPGDHRTTKHIGTKINFAQEAQTNGYIKLVYVPTAEHLADGMSMALPFSLFQSIFHDYYLHRYEFNTLW